MSEVTHRVKLTKGILAATDQNASRFALNAVLVTAVQDCPWLVASDGRILAAVQTEGESPEAALIPPSAFPAKNPKRGRCHVAELNGKWESGDAKAQSYRTITSVSGESHVERCMPAIDGPRTQSQLVEGRFPQVRSLLPSDVDPEQITTLSLNVELLSKMATAMGVERVTLILRPADKDGQHSAACLAIGGKDDSGNRPMAFGVIMPLAGGSNAVDVAHWNSMVKESNVQ